MYCLKVGEKYNIPTDCPTSFAGIENFDKLPDSEKAQYGWYPLVKSDVPVYDKTIETIDTTHTLNDGIVYLQYSVRPLTAEEITAKTEASVRALARAITPFLNTAYARRGYENHISARAIRSSSNPVWSQEGVEACDYYDLVWNAFETMKNNVIAGGNVPTAEEFFAQFPVLWDTSE
jgi:hypothetical protein